MDFPAPFGPRKAKISPLLKADVFDNRCSLIGFTELLNADTCLHDIPPLQNACFSAVYANQEGDISQNTCGNSGVLGYMNYRL